MSVLRKVKRQLRAEARRLATELQAVREALTALGESAAPPAAGVTDEEAFAKSVAKGDEEIVAHAPKRRKSRTRRRTGHRARRAPTKAPSEALPPRLVPGRLRKKPAVRPAARTAPPSTEPPAPIPVTAPGAKKTPGGRVYRTCPFCKKRTETNPCHVCGRKDPKILMSLAEVAPPMSEFEGDTPPEDGRVVT